ncbi:MAG TPA: SpoIIE family protein phosphatase [Kofleriaceae bacterium]|nr:SpoIIE family protein phosphatase [Kofleriaceae bacterium]
MKLRTTVFLWVLLLVVVVVGATIGTIAVVFDRSTRDRVASELVRSRDVTLDLHANRSSLHRQECRVVAEEPRLRAVVATEDVARETILDAVRTLAETLRAGVFVIVDSEGSLIADSAAPDAAGFAMTDRPVVADALAKGEGGGIWLADDKAFQVQGCRLEFGARVVGALVVGHAIDNEFANTIARQTGGWLVVVADRAALTALPIGAKPGELGTALDEVRAGTQEVTLGGTHWYAQVVPMPGYSGNHRVEYLLLRSIDEALAPARKIVRILFMLLGGAALATLILALGLARRLSRPIDALVTRTQAIAHGDLAPKPVSGPTEVRALGSAMDRMAAEIDESRRSLADKERLAREMEIAARIQTSILPRNIAVDGLEITARMMTASEVGGDYYDVLTVDDGCWIAVGDASGHGLTAGLVMMMVQTGVATLVRSQPDGHPKDVLRTLNRVLFENVHDRLEAERHMTLSLMRYHGGGKLTVAGAHMDAVWWRAASQTVEMLGTKGTFLAITDDIDHVNVEQEWSLAPGDLLVLLTDGVTEAEGASGKPFGYDGVVEVLEPRATKPVVAIQDALFDAVTKHSPTLADDCTILVLRYVGPGETDR